MKYFFIFLFFYNNLFASRALTTINIDSISASLIFNPKFIDANIGISIYNIDEKKNEYNFQSNKKFLPSSNLKLFVAYLGLKYLPKNLEVFQYREDNGVLILSPSADPTFLYKNFYSQAVINFLKQDRYKKIIINTSQWQENPWSAGWVWDDYQDDFMSPKSLFPMYGNAIEFYLENNQLYTYPKIDKKHYIHFNNNIDIVKTKFFKIGRNFNANDFSVLPSAKAFKRCIVPLLFNDFKIIENMFEQIVHKEVIISNEAIKHGAHHWQSFSNTPKLDALTLMMKESDNFIAEHLMLMLSKQLLGVMNVKELIKKIIAEDFSEFPNIYPWQDASGLSRYNLISPNEFILLLVKMINEFDLGTLNTIFATGNEGTLKNFFINHQDNIYAKTGSMSNSFALSGYFVSKTQPQTFAFSVMINGCTEGTSSIKKEVEKYIIKLIEQL